jgi:hypothetical protein
VGNQDRERVREAEVEAEKAPDIVSQKSERQRLRVEVIEVLSPPRIEKRIGNGSNGQRSG